MNPSDTVSAAIETLTFYGVISQQSQYGRISKKKLIYPAARDTRLTTVPDMMLPSYLERRFGNTPEETWVYIPSTGDADLESERIHGEGRCAFTKQEDGFHLVLTYNPIGFVHRLSYYAEPVVAKTLGDALDRGSRWGYLYTHKTIIGAGAVMNMKYGALPPERQLTLTSQLSALAGALAYSNSQVAHWEELFDNEKDASRNPKARMRRPILGRGHVGRRTY